MLNVSSLSCFPDLSNFTVLGDTGHLIASYGLTCPLWLSFTSKTILGNVKINFCEFNHLLYVKNKIASVGEAETNLP